MKPRTAAVMAVTWLIIGLGIGCVTAATSAAGQLPRTTSQAREKTVRRNIRVLQIALQCYCVDRHDRWPPNVSAVHLLPILKSYVCKYGDPWPTNPYTHRPVREARKAGDFTYKALDHRKHYRMIGWGPHGKRIIVVP